MQIIVGDFYIHNQERTQKGSVFTGTREELLEIVQRSWALRERGYRDGVWLVPVPGDSLHLFRSGEVELVEGDELAGVYTARKPGEVPRKSLVAKIPVERRPIATSARVAVYEEWVLAESPGHVVRDCDAEVVTVLAQAHDLRAPMTPDTLMANHFGDSGGTATNMSPEQFEAALRDSYTYWRGRAVAG